MAMSVGPGRHALEVAVGWVAHGDAAHMRSVTVPGGGTA